jgi:peptide-methionine (S)-S-oxide reductase
VPSLDLDLPVELQTASFAFGCAEAQLGSVSGVVRTRVGYAGGTTKDPTYHNLGDYAETVQVDFDPSKITYVALVESFFAAHDATLPASRRQYMSAIFFHDAEQERVARAVLQRVQQDSDGVIQTLILPMTGFYLAEDYHQKYALQGDSLLLGEFRAMYPEFRDLVDSTAAARVNAYVYGFGTAEQLKAELDGLGLSEAGRTHLQAASPVGACALE